MEDSIPDGTVAIIDGVRRIHYDGYWLKAYEPPADTLDTLGGVQGVPGLWLPHVS